VGTIGILGYIKIMPSFKQAKDIEITVIPEEVEVFNDFSDTRPLHINIENKSGDEIEFQTTVDFPDEVDWRYRDRHEGSGTFEATSSVPGEGGHEPYNIELRYRETERKMVEVAVTVEKGDDIYTENIILVLEEF